MASINRMVQRVKDDVCSLLDPAGVTAACVAAGHRWRVRELDPVTLVSVMMLQVLYATSCRGALRVAGIDVTPTAYCKAKRKLPLEVLHRLMLTLARREQQVSSDAQGFRGFRGRVVMVDGSSASMPDTPSLQDAFGQPGGATPGCGFPVVHLLALIDQAHGTIRDLLTHPCDTHDLTHTPKLHPMLEEGDILLGDRAFCSYAHLCLLLRDNLHGVLRLHQKQIVSFKAGRKHKRRLPKADRAKAPSSRFITRMGKHDQLVEYRKPKECPRWMTPANYAKLPETITVRELRYRIKAQRGRPRNRTREVTLVTTLVDCEKYPQEEIAKLYQSRWEIETRLCEFKQTLGANVLRSTSEQGVLKDLWTHVLVFNLIRLLMLRHAKERGGDPRRLSFIDARDVLRYRRDGPIPQLAYHTPRPGRDEPRTIKRRKDTYTVMTRPRETLRQELENKTLTA